MTFLKADFFIVLASDFKTKLHRWGLKRPVHLFSTTIDESLLEYRLNTKFKKKTLSGQLRILFLSRVEKEKGIFETIDATKILLDKGYNISLTIAGEGTSMESIRFYINKLNLNGIVSLIGFVSGKKKAFVLETHHIYCLPSYSEGLPISILEAMAFGMPIVTRPVGGLKDFFHESSMGLFSMSKSPEEIAERIETILLDRAKFHYISEYNFKFANKNLLASQSAKKLLGIYDQLIKP